MKGNAMTSLAQLERDGRIAVKDYSQHDWRRYAETAKYALIRQGYRDDDAEEWSDAGMVTVMELWKDKMVSPQRAKRDVLLASYAARNAETTRPETAAEHLPEHVGDRLELRTPEQPAAAAARAMAETIEIRALTRQYAGLGAAILGSLRERIDVSRRVVTHEPIGQYDTWQAIPVRTQTRVINHPGGALVCNAILPVENMGKDYPLCVTGFWCFDGSHI